MNNAEYVMYIVIFQVNNAGYVIKRRFEQTTRHMLDDMYAVHVRGMFDITQRAIPHLVKEKGMALNISPLC